MKKLLALLLAAMMLLSLAACGDNNTTDPDKDNPGVSQSGENNNGQGDTENQGSENSNGGENSTDNNDQGNASVTGNGEWPKNEWTSHVPEADGTVLKIDENMDTGMGKAYVIYMDWTDADALAYQQKLVDAGKIKSVGELINDVYYLLFIEPETGRKVMINEIGETENDYVIVLYK